MEIDWKAVGRRIKSVRDYLGMTQEDFADVLNVNLNHITKIESGTNHPSLDLLVEIAELVTEVRGIAWVVLLPFLPDKLLLRLPQSHGTPSQTLGNGNGAVTVPGFG